MKIIKAVTKNPLAAILVVLLVVTGLWALKLKWDLHTSTSALQEATTERDRLALEAVADRAEADGWMVQWGDSVGNLRKILAGRDSSAATLAADLHTSRARVSALAEVTARLRGQVESFGSPVVPPESGSEGLEPSQWSGELSDGLLTASWRFWAMDARLVLDPYSVEISGELIGTVGGDGSRVVFARAHDPRATLSLGQYTFQPAPPVIETRCTATRSGVLMGIGFLGGVWTGAKR